MSTVVCMYIFLPAVHWINGGLTVFFFFFFTKSVVRTVKKRTANAVRIFYRPEETDVRVKTTVSSCRAAVSVFFVKNRKTSGLDTGDFESQKRGVIQAMIDERRGFVWTVHTTSTNKIFHTIREERTACTLGFAWRTVNIILDTITTVMK